MEILTASEIVSATGGRLVLGTADRRCKGISTDSRTVGVGELFVPLAGERFDGHDYLGQALSRGAAGFIFSNETGAAKAGELQRAPGATHLFAVEVRDTLEGLHALARYYRAQFDIPVVGVTGSVGKTSTKDMIASVLRERFRTVATVANYNNEIGIPLTVFGLDRASEVLVAEMGMRGPGQIAELVGIAQPTVGVVTNVGETHLELLGSKENIARAKAELVAGLPADGAAVLNGDDPLVSAMSAATRARVVRYGLTGEHSPRLDCQASHIESFGVHGVSFDVEAQGLRFPVELRIPGVHNVHNALAAVATGLVLGLTVDEIRRGLARVELSAMRLTTVETTEGWLVINDAYNASPVSVRAALRILVESRRRGRTVAVLGDMLELGPVAEAAHERIGREAAGVGVDLLVGVGPLSARTVAGARAAGLAEVWAFDNNTSAAEALPGLLRRGDVVLVKGSRGMRMETIVKALTNEGETGHA